MKKLLIVVTALFFIIMITFTFISRHTAISLLPEVEAVYVEYNMGKLVLPYTAVATDIKGNSIVYVLWDEKSILGTVTVVKRENVEVVDQKDDKVVITGIQDISHRPFVKDASADINDGDRVRIS